MNKGQVVNGGMIAVALMTAAVTWVGNYVLSSPAQSSQAIASVQNDLTTLKSFKEAQLQTNKELLDAVNRLNNNVVKLLVANHLQPSDN